MADFCIQRRPGQYAPLHILKRCCLAACPACLSTCNADTFLSASEDGTVREIDVRIRPPASARGSDGQISDDTNVLGGCCCLQTCWCCCLGGAAASGTATALCVAPDVAAGCTPPATAACHQCLVAPDLPLDGRAAGAACFLLLLLLTGSWPPGPCCAAIRWLLRPCCALHCLPPPLLCHSRALLCHSQPSSAPSVPFTGRSGPAGGAHGALPCAGGDLQPGRG